LAIKEWISEGGGKLNIKILLDGEEESASKSLFEKLFELKEKLACDYFLVVDFDMLDEKTPAITLGARGIVPLEIEIENSIKDVHSGAHGGVILNPLKEMVCLLQKLWDKEGHIAIDHIYDDVDFALTDQ